MTNKDKEEMTEHQAPEESIDTDELKEKVLKQSKWLKLIWIILFLIIYAFSGYVLILLSVVQFLYVLGTDSPNENLTNVSSGFRRYISQIINYLTYESSEKPFPFNPFPSKED